MHKHNPLRLKESLALQAGVNCEYAAESNVHFIRPMQLPPQSCLGMCELNSKNFLCKEAGITTQIHVTEVGGLLDLRSR